MKEEQLDAYIVSSRSFHIVSFRSGDATTGIEKRKGEGVVSLEVRDLREPWELRGQCR
jgi:hypothetical protein